MEGWSCGPVQNAAADSKKQNQDHYCGKAPKTIDEYIAGQPEKYRPYLKEVREAIRAALPEAEERISWSMPTFWKKHNLIHFACFQKHIGLYPGPEAVEEFREQLSDYKTSKGAIHLPYDKPLPFALIKTIAEWCYEANDL